jgi:hypothetical protein
MAWSAAIVPAGRAHHGHGNNNNAAGGKTGHLSGANHTNRRCFDVGENNMPLASKRGE